MSGVKTVEEARRVYLLVLCGRSNEPVARGYLREKVIRIYDCRTYEEVRGLLDLEGQREFDRLAGW